MSICFPLWLNRTADADAVHRDGSRAAGWPAIENERSADFLCLELILRIRCSSRIKSAQKSFQRYRLRPAPTGCFRARHAISTGSLGSGTSDLVNCSL